MSQFQYRKQDEKEKRGASGGSNSGGRRTCPNCGEEVAPGDAFCCECGAQLPKAAGAQTQTQTQQETQTARQEMQSTGTHCPHCHKEIPVGVELCPHCGKPVRDDHCTFCGSIFEGNEAFCMECGSARGGIRCPKCGTVSFRSFCSKCNSPLNDNAYQALKQAQNDPKFQRAQRLYQEMASMETYLEAFKEEVEKAIAEAEMEGDAPDMPGLSQEGEALQAKYAELMQLLGQKVEAPKKTPGERPSVKRREQLKERFRDIDQVMEAYKAKAAEMQAALAALVPEVEMTPQQYRDFACARKICIDTRVQKRVPQYWICNWCHCYHDQPSECAREELGGTWTYQTVTVGEKIWKYMD